MSNRKLPERETRGKRLNTLVNEEIEQDNAFYSSVFENKEEEDVEDFQEGSDEEEDVVDSDFDISEDEEEAEVEIKEVKEPEIKKKEVYVDPLKTPTKRKVGRPRKSETPQEKKPKEIKKIEKRKSTREKTKIDSEQLAKKLENLPEKRKKRKTQHRILTQEELLEEAKITAKYNQESLQELINMEEEKRVKNTSSKKNQLSTPFIRTLSRENSKTISFIGFEKTPKALLKTVEDPLKLGQEFTCYISGKTAKFQDPLTKVYYYNLDAFKKIRIIFEEFKKEIVDPNVNFERYLVSKVK